MAISKICIFDFVCILFTKAVETSEHLRKAKKISTFPPIDVYPFTNIQEM